MAYGAFLGLLTFIYVFCFRSYTVPSGNMQPTIPINGRFVANLFSYGIQNPFGNGRLVEFTKPKRGEVIVFRFPEDPAQTFVKRIVGLPGDKIRMDKQGDVFVNGERIEQKSDLETSVCQSMLSAIRQNDQFMGQNDYRCLDVQSGAEKYQILEMKNHALRVEQPEVEIPAGRYFVLGDNRDNSNDSRYWGFVPHDNIIGRLSFSL